MTGQKKSQTVIQSDDDEPNEVIPVASRVAEKSRLYYKHFIFIDLM